MFQYKADDTTHDDDKRLCWNHALVWKQPLKTSRQPDTDDTTDGGAGCDEDVKEAHGGGVCDA